MKRALACAVLALTAVASHADTIGIATNSGGGVIRLMANTSAECSAMGPEYMVVLSTMPDVNTPPYRGCWRVLDSNAHVIWNDGNERLFPLSRFTRVPSATRNRGQSL